MRHLAIIQIAALLAGCTGMRLEREAGGGAHKVCVADVRSESFAGVILDNRANRAGYGAGFRPLFYSAYPRSPIFRPEFVGLNFEHVFNGTAADKELCMFTPRRDYCAVLAESPQRVSIRWPAGKSSWDLDCTMTYALTAPDTIDMHFEVTPRSERFPLGFAAFMWASYMNRTRDRRIHFIGSDNGGPEGWMSFGEDLPDGGFETGTVACAGVEPLPHEPGTETLNLLEHASKRFTQPFYYGFIDGDNDLGTTGDDLAYIMCFDQAEPMRFALWNFITGDDDKPDAHSPAWDWQYVIRNPEVGKTYGYRAKLILKPFAGREGVARVVGDVTF